MRFSAIDFSAASITSSDLRPSSPVTSGCLSSIFQKCQGINHIWFVIFAQFGITETACGMTSTWLSLLSSWKAASNAF
jgi:hypothetical protein